MNCIFCQQESSNSKSIEHIIPESLGNKHHILWKGAVCDKCNNYFATKIEKELLEQPYFINMRFRNEIKTKKDRYVKNKVLVLDKKNGFINAFFQNTDCGMSICFENEINNKIKKGKIIMPNISEPEINNKIMSRFLVKCALEYLLYNLGFDYHIFIQEKQFDSLRKYARYGEGEFWQYTQRRIYSEGNYFTSSECYKPYEILHEMDLLVTDSEKISDNIICSYIYFVIVIMGIEYVISFVEPEINGYLEWLKLNNNKYPIHIINEKMLDIGMYDVNPLLIKTDTKCL